ncbi:unnamed protein product [Brachionus calyciflorus]|uniref:Uncharacterized protein n=1 Tax=Brachionus calyciflorus TaxID=104777 RepID=A0A814M5A5_9BILA|nr:unnamed protein product [Brachionus calyciflorus]
MDYIETDFEFIKKKLIRLFDSVLFAIFLGVLIVIQIATAYIGIQNLMNCPIQPKIPVYLFIFGSFGLVKILNVFYEIWKRSKKEQLEQSNILGTSGYDHGMHSERDSNGARVVDALISLFLLIWFIVGNYWVISIWKPNFIQPPEIDSHKWCEETVYMSAVFQLILFYALIFLFLLVIFFLFISSRLKHYRLMKKYLEEASENVKV